jgi:hypothetical protein
MVLPPHLAQASARAPRPSPPTTAQTVLSVQVSPYYQRGSTMPLAVSPASLASHFPHCTVPFRSMGGGCTRARSHDRSYGSSAPAPMSFGASMPTYSPCHLNIMGGGYSPTAWTSTPLVGVTPSCHPTAIVEWAARASADAVSEYAHEILAYWDANASPHERTLFWEKNAGPPLYSRRSIKERLLANAQSEVRRAQWVCTYLAMSVSPPHPHLHKGGSTGPMAPSPAVTPQVSSPSPSKARPPKPAHLTKTASHHHMHLSSSSPSPAIPKGGGASLAEHRAATVLQCWKRRIWLRRWFDQQALLKQKRLRLQSLCRIDLCQLGSGKSSFNSDPDRKDLRPEGFTPSIPHSWPAATTAEEGPMTQMTALLPRSKAPAPCSRFWRGAVVYATDLLRYTNYKLWQHLIFLELGTLTLLLTLAPPLLPQLFNTPTAIILFDVIVASYLVSGSLRSRGRLIRMPTIALLLHQCTKNGLI